MKQSNVKIKWKIFAYLTIFVFVIAGFLWVFQTVLLNQFYEMTKTNNVKTAALDVQKELESENLSEIAENYLRQDNLCIHILDEKLEIGTEGSHPRQCIVKKLDMAQLQELYNESANNNGEILKTYDYGKNGNSPPENQPPQVNEDGSKKEETQPPKENSENNGTGDNKKGKVDMKNLLYAKVVTLPSGENRLILIDTPITPLDSAIATLRIQLTYATLVFIVGAAILTMILSKKVANPIVKVNNTAKELAKGDYSVNFEGEGYLEISQLKDTLNYAVSELGKTEKLQRELIANISHDLRTPLTMITGYSEAMRDLPGENSPENIQLIIDEANRLTRLVSDVLDISKLQTGTQEINRERVNLTAVVKRVIERCGKLIEKDGYTITFDAKRDIYVLGDEVRLNQVVYNLLSNAITYTGEDKTVKVKQEVKNESVNISITDTGQGIEQDKQEDIWQRYYKLGGNHQRSATGSGLGLSIVKQIVLQHAGQCGVESAIGKGSTFWFRLNTVK